MVAHLVAAGVFAAATLGATANGVDDEDQEEENENNAKANKKQRGVFSEDEDDDDEGDSPSILRSIEQSERFASTASSMFYRTPDGAIRLTKTLDEEHGGDVGDVEPVVSSSSTLQHTGYVHGNFGTGKIRDLNVGKCYTVAYHPSPTMQLLAVGLSEGLALYETCSYTLVYHVPFDDMVSTLSWVTKQEPDDSNHNSLLVIGTLDGLMALYRVNVHILESQGPSLLYQFRVNGQVRALSSCFYDSQNQNSFHATKKLDQSSPSSLWVACGTKTGQLTLINFSSRNSNNGSLLESEGEEPAIATRVIALESTAVLSLDFESDKAYVAWSTKAGQVVVRQLARGHEADADFNATADKETAVDDDSVELDQRPMWSTRRQGPVRCVLFSKRHPYLIFGGYDKTVVIVDTELWAICRQLHLHGTINTLSLDHEEERYLTVGSRDKTFKIFDTSTYVNIKSFHTPGWVTSISWMSTKKEEKGGEDMTVAIRSDNSTVSILNLAPIHLTDVRLSLSPSTEKQHQGKAMESASSPCLSWTRNGRFLARGCGSTLVVSDVLENFRGVCTVTLGATVLQVAFCNSFSDDHNRCDGTLAAVDALGLLSLFSLHVESSSIVSLKSRGSVMVEKEQHLSLKALAWAPDGSFVVTGGRNGMLHFICARTLAPIRDPISMKSRVWDIDFVKKRNKADTKHHHLAVALGDYTAVLLNGSFEPSLQIMRSRTARCLAFHPSQALVAVGDGEGVVAVVDYEAEEIIKEFSVHGRVNVLKFSPVGDYLLVGTDDCVFSLREAVSYQNLQEIGSVGFALAAAFSPKGTHLALGDASGSYSLVRLGPFLSIDLVPIGREPVFDTLPSWAQREVLFRSGYGPSFVQRHMIEGRHENLTRVADILRQHSDAMYAFNRKTGEGSFDTALALKRPNLLKLAVTMLVDGTLDESHSGQKSILTTGIPLRGRNTLMDFMENHPPEYIVSILSAMVFTKVPYTEPHVVEMNSRRRLECSSCSFMDPWVDELGENRSSKRGKIGLGKSFKRTRGHIALTPAVLPLPNLGDLEFLSGLLVNAPPSAFDNDAMAVVLGVMWRDHVRKYFFVDCVFFVAFYACWVLLLELMILPNGSIVLPGTNSSVSGLSLSVVCFNSLYLSKETIQSGFCRRRRYFLSLWNWVDVLSMICIYVFVLASFVSDTGASLIPLAVVTTLLLTVKLLSYLRGFSDTGWLISVLIANFRDVRGFLVILFAILVGFAVSFRLLFGDTGDASFESLRMSFLSTFEITIMGTYDSDMLYEARFRTLATVTFILAVTCVLVIALNALISILGDSYAKVQEHAVANRRNERAGLIVEYMTLLPSWYRRRIERRTRWFHVLLEVDADDQLLVKKDDWEGGLNALRRGMQSMEERTLEQHQKVIEQVRNELDAELLKFKKEVMSALGEVLEDVKKLRILQSEGGITFSGKNVAKAVRAVKSIQQKGEALFNPGRG